MLSKNGIFAWSGLLVFWLVAAFSGVWFLVMTWQLWVSIATLARRRRPGAYSR